jgi:hypothetical protein
LSDTRNTSLERYRKRIKRQGIVRVEVSLRKEDASLVRDVARALNDPERRVEARRALSRRFGQASTKGLKALLAAAPLEGIDIERSRDTGRTVDL